MQPSRVTQYLVLTNLVLALLFFDVCAPVFIKVSTGSFSDATMLGGMLLGGTLGVVIGQLNLVGVWAALAPGKLIVRLPWSLVLLTLMWYALVLGNHVTEWNEMQYASTIGIQLLAGFFTVQIPLWIAGQAQGWRLHAAEMGGEKVSLAEQINIRELIIATSLLAGLLSLGRVILPLGDTEVWLDSELMVIIVAMIFTNLLVVVPCVWIAFSKLENLLTSLLVWGFLVFFISPLEFGILCGFLGTPGSDGDAILAVFIGMNYCQCATVLGVLAALRFVAGYQLSRQSAADVDAATTEKDLMEATADATSAAIEKE